VHKTIAAPICALTILVSLSMWVVVFPFFGLMRLYSLIFPTNVESAPTGAIEGWLK
jgi:hypothetical protein